MEKKTKEEEILVFGSTDGVYVFDGKRVKKIVKRDDLVMALAICGNELYDGDVAIRRAMDGEVILHFRDFIFL